MGKFSIRLPPTFVLDSTSGRWEEAPSPKHRTFPSNLTVLIGPMRGYAPSSFGGDVRQVQLHECKLGTPSGSMEVASYVVEWAGPADLPTHYIAAHSRLANDTAVLVLAEAHDSITQAKFIAALRTLVVRPR